MPKTVREYIELLKTPSLMTKEDARELSDLMKIIGASGHVPTAEEKELSDAVWKHVDAMRAEADRQNAEIAAGRETRAREHYDGVRRRSGESVARHRVGKTASDLAKNPFDVEFEIEKEYGRHLGKGRFAHLLDNMRLLEDADPDLKEIADILDLYVQNGANASRLRTRLADETSRMKTLCEKADAFRKKQEERQLDDQNNEELGLRLLAIAEETDMMLREQRDGSLDTAFPFTVPTDPATGNSAWEALEPVTVNSSGKWIKLKVSRADDGKIRGDRELDMTNEPLFPHDPSPLDVSQGRLGDCYLLSGLASVAAKDPQKIRDMMCDNGDGTVTVRFFQKQISDTDGSLEGYRPILVTVDKTVPDYAGAQDCLWVSMIERAYAAADLHTGKSVVQGAAKWDSDARAVYNLLKTSADFTGDLMKYGVRERYPFLLTHDGELRSETEVLDYTNITAGQPSVPMEQILGPGGEGEKLDLETMMNGGTRAKDKNGDYLPFVPPQAKVGEAERFLTKALADGSVLAAGTYGETDKTIGNGVLTGHAYSVLAIGKKTVDGHTETFVTVRDPHAKGGRKYVDENGVLTAKEWNSPSGVFDVKLDDFCREFASVDICHMEKTAVPEKQDDVLKGKYLSDRSAMAYRDALLELHREGDSPEYLFSAGGGFEDLRIKLKVAAGNLSYERGHTMENAAKSTALAGTRSALGRYVGTNAGVNSRQRTVDFARNAQRLFDAMEKGYAEPSFALRETVAEKILLGEAAKKLASRDPQVKAQGTELNGLLTDPARKAEREKRIADVARDDVTVAYILSGFTFPDACRFADQTPENIYKEYAKVEPAVTDAVNKHKAKLAAQPPKRTLPESAKQYGRALKDAQKALLKTDKHIMEYKNSDQYRSLRDALNAFNDKLLDPAMADKSRRELAACDEAKALREACAAYRAHCADTPKQRFKERRIERLARAESIERLLDGLENGVYEDPRDFARRQLSEKAARGLQNALSASDDDALIAEGERQRALLDGPDCRQRDALIVARYGEPGFRAMVKNSSFYSLSKMASLPDSDVIGICMSEQQKWEKKHPTKEKRLEKNEKRPLYELVREEKSPKYVLRADPAPAQPAQPNVPAQANVPAQQNAPAQGQPDGGVQINQPDEGIQPSAPI